MKEYKIKDLLTIRNGRDHKHLGNGVFPVYGSGGIMRYANDYLYNKPSILLPRKGTLDNIQYCDSPFWCVDTTYYSEVNEELVNPYYLYRYLNLLDLRNLDSGTALPSMTFDSYYQIKVKLPNIEIQNKIAKVLYSIDQKIALNTRMNAELEAMAKQLYDYWFVQFDFPDENGKPYKSSGGKMVWNEKLKREIPEGWEVVDIKCVCEIIDCLHSKKPDYFFESENSYLLSLENITKNGYVDLTKKYYISDKDFEVWTNRVCVKAGDFLFTNAGRAGDWGMVPKGIECAIGRNITCVRPLAVSSFYLRGFFSSLYLQEQVIKNLDQGSFFMSFNVRSIKELQILMPEESMLSLFISTIKPFVCQIEKQNKELYHLTHLRDSLLPMLMNGQVTIE